MTPLRGQRLSITLLMALLLPAAPLTGISGNLRHRIIAPITERMTSYNSTKGEEKSAECTVTFNGFDGIAGTGWGKTTAGRKKRRDEITIPPDQTEADPLYQQTNPHWARNMLSRQKYCFSTALPAYFI